jgi:hypothetical protein
MSRLKEAEKLLRDLGIPKQYNSGLMQYAFLALLNIDDRSEWKESSNTKLLRLHDIFAYIKEIFEINYAENSRETLTQVRHNPPQKPNFTPYFKN